MLVVPASAARTTTWDMNLHAVNAVCSVACLAWSRGTAKGSKPALQKRLEDEKKPSRKAPRLFAVWRCLTGIEVRTKWQSSRVRKDNAVHKGKPPARGGQNRRENLLDLKA